MNQWADRIQSHPVVAALKELQSTLSEIIGSPKTETDVLPVLRRSLLVVEDVLARIDAIEPALVAPASLDSIEQPAQQILAQIQTFATNHESPPLSDVDQHLDSLLAEVGKLITPLTAHRRLDIFQRQAKLAGDRLDSLESKANARLAELEKRVEGQLASLDSVSETVASAKAEIESAAASGNEAVQATAAEAKAEIETQRKRLDEAIAQHQGIFGEEQDRRSTEFIESQQAREADATERLEKLSADFREERAAWVTEVTTIVSDLRDHEVKATEILGATAASVVAGAYVEEAKDQRKQADLWRVLALAVGLVFLSAAVGTTVLAPPDGDPSITDLSIFAVERLPAGLILGTIFAYAFRQSASHRDREESARQLAMELSTFRPFLAELPEHEQQEAIKEVARRYFPGQKNIES